MNRGLAALHPQVVHFTIVLVIVGVAFRLVSLLGRPAFASPAATTLLLLAALSSVLSIQSGTAAHGRSSACPARACRHGARGVGRAHAERLLVLGVIELLGLAMRGSRR